MSQPTFEQFFSAISEQESGGRYSALGVVTRSGDRAYGKYQVMGSNIPSWTAKYYGKRLTPSQYLNSPAAQEATARGVLQSYYNKYGARGAASAWYSGSPNLDQSTSSQYGGPSIKSYVDSVVSKAYRYPSSGGGSGGSRNTTTTTTHVGTGAAGSAPKPMTAAETAESFGFVQSLINSNADLKKVFSQALKGQWTPQRFQAALRDTGWFKHHDAKERDFLIKQYGDPASAKQDLSQAYVHARQLANSLGMQETASNKAKLNTWAYNIAAHGWNDDQLRYDMGKYVFFNNDIHQGEGGADVDKLQAFTYSMGVKMSGSWYTNAARAIVRGVATQQDYEDQVRRQAKSLFPQWSKQLDSGQTVADIASPYMQSMSQILEVPAGSVNLFDPAIKKALQAKDPNTGANTVTPIWQFENTLRSDPRWKGTKNAQDSMMQTAHQVLADFGLKT